MKYKNIFDTHTHSIYSFDGNDSCKELCESLILNGGIGIAITDHCDIDGDDDFDTLAKNQYDDISALKREY
ncbi:MAG: PHP domain-containing protein, partial [Eubacterium sp.]